MDISQAKQDVEWLKTFEMWIWRRMMRILWTEQKINEVLPTVGTPTELTRGRTESQTEKMVGTLL